MRAKPKITIFTSPNCPWCHKSKEWLKAHSFSFKEIDVASDPKAADEMVEKSGQRGVPVIDIDGQIVVGFNEPALKKALGVK